MSLSKSGYKRLTALFTHSAELWAAPRWEGPMCEGMEGSLRSQGRAESHSYLMGKQKSRASAQSWKLSQTPWLNPVRGSDQRTQLSFLLQRNPETAEGHNRRGGGGGGFLFKVRLKIFRPSLFPKSWHPVNPGRGPQHGACMHGGTTS